MHNTFTLIKNTNASAIVKLKLDNVSNKLVPNDIWYMHTIFNVIADIHEEIAGENYQQTDIGSFNIDDPKLMAAITTRDLTDLTDAFMDYRSVALDRFEELRELKHSTNTVRVMRIHGKDFSVNIYNPEHPDNNQVKRSPESILTVVFPTLGTIDYLRDNSVNKGC